MRKLLILFVLVFLLFPIVNAEKPEDVNLNGFVNDYAGVLDDAQESAISDVLKSLYDNGTAQIAVVTIKSLEGQDINGFAFKVAEGKLGDKEKNNGLLLLVSIEDRKYRFEVGRGLEPLLNDAKVGRIGRNDLVPAFREGKYGEGILNAVNDIKEEISNPTADSGGVYEISRTVILIMFFVILIFLPVIGYFLIKSVKKAGKNKGKNYDKMFIAGYMLSGMMRGGRGGFSGGSGGFGGFGGGSFGGGGAGGGW